MNLLCITNAEIGTMGQLMMTIENIEDKISHLDHIEGITIRNTRERINANPFDHIFIPHNSSTPYTEIYVSPVKHPYRESIPPDRMLKYKTIISKFVINPEITERFENIKNELSINETFLGVHVRLSDMNAAHANSYGFTYFEDFVTKIDEVMETNEYSKIFIASDTQEAIGKLKTIYGNKMICYDDFDRLKEEYGDLISYIARNLPTNKKWIQDTFIEMLLLGRCGGLIHRVTNFANITKVYSNTIKKEYFLQGTPWPNTEKPWEASSLTHKIYVENGEIRSTKKE